MEEQILIENTWIMGKKIGKGGFGSIYLTTNIHTKEIAAVKIEDLMISELLYGESAVVKSLQNASKAIFHSKRVSPNTSGAAYSPPVPPNSA